MLDAKVMMAKHINLLMVWLENAGFCDNTTYTRDTKLRL